MINVVLASSNAGKLSELNDSLSELGVRFTSQSEHQVSDAIEDGLTFVENAIIKARHASKQTGLPALADDSGLAVDALGGAPGIYSARYSGDRDDRSNYLKLLRDMEGQQDRSAHFICCLVLVRHWQDPTPVICQGDWLGEIATEPKGLQGFGYDPVFLPNNLAVSAAELSKAEKSAISHRGKAVEQLKQYLSNHPTWLTSGG